MQEKAGEQGAAYIPMPKGRGFTPHFDKLRIAKYRETILSKSANSICLSITASQQ